MNWKKMTIGKRVGAGFGVVLALLAGACLLSYSGVGRIVENAKEVIAGNALDATLAQKVVDHMVWSEKVNALLTDDTVTTLDVATDDHNCSLGRWLYGEGRTQAEALTPAIAPLLRELEAPHRQMHASAIEIGKAFKQADRHLPVLLTEKEIDHLKWAGKIRDALIHRRDSLGVQTDPAQCALGKWLATAAARKAYDNGSAEFKKSWDAMLVSHSRLHLSAIEMEKNSVYRRLSEIHEAQAALLKACSLTGDKLIALLQEVMEETIDPAKSRAEKALDVVAMARWSEIDMNLNEELIQPFLELRVLVSTLSGKNLETQWPACEQKYQQFRDGATAWSRLVDGEPLLAQTAENARQLGLEWKQNADLLHGNIVDETAAEAVIQKANQIYDEVTMPLLNQTLSQLEVLKTEAELDLAGIERARAIYATQTLPALHKVHQSLNAVRAETRKQMLTDEALLQAAEGTRRNITMAGIAAVFTGLLLAYVIARGIGSALKKISFQLGESAAQVASASGQMTSAGQSLAEGASEQAASIEETSSSMEEMSAMTQQNAANANQADSLMKAASQVVGKANSSMAELTGSMEGIAKASEETSKIIKTIDEIAFQTNLLALNAAVEAARAGEAGAGFAVVADEVRNLALRAADAAKNTAGLIEGTVQKVQEGKALVTVTGEAFSEVAATSAKVGALINEISLASNEQAQGVEQVNTAVAEMDKVTQANAANAEESASAAEEMSAQAEQMRDFVEELVALVDGKAEGRGAGNAKSRIKAARATATSERAAKRPPGVRKKAASRPEKVIPMAEDFSDFNA